VLEICVRLLLAERMVEVGVVRVDDGDGLARVGVRVHAEVGDKVPASRGVKGA
jgi:hypothetical protein